jgi:ABC-type Fe3+ transport system substrate-binding protein
MTDVGEVVGPRVHELEDVVATGRVRNVERDRSDAEIDLRDLATGEYEPTIAAWRPDGSSSPRVVKLPTVAVVGSATGPSGRP